MICIQIAPNDTGAHENQTVDSAFLKIPPGWAILPDDMETPNFPFGDITVNDSTPPIVTSWTPLPIPEPEPAPDPEPTADEVLNALLGVNEE